MLQGDAGVMHLPICSVQSKSWAASPEFMLGKRLFGKRVSISLRVNSVPLAPPSCLRPSREEADLELTSPCSVCVV